jgi:glucose-1-phosphate thymidylyltransferase
VNVVFLAAGFGTRLVHIIGDRPKALVEVGGMVLLDHLLARVRCLPDVERILLVSNHHYLEQFRAWQRGSGANDVEILDDGARDAESRLGAIGDLAFALERLGAGQDALVLAADNVLGFELGPLVDRGRATGSSVVAVRRNPDLEDQRLRGNLELAADGRVVAFVEKPEVPIGPWSSAPLYYFQATALGRVREYLDAGGHRDAPGHFLAWLHTREPLQGWEQTGPLLDVGNPVSWAEAEQRIAEDPARYGLRPA